MYQLAGLSNGEAFAINDNDQIAGVTSENGDTRAFLYDHGTITVITVPLDMNFARGINNLGQVVGAGSSADQPGAHALLWSPVSR